MIGCEVSYETEKDKGSFLLDVDRKGKGTITVQEGAKVLTFMFDFFDPNLEEKLLPEIELKYSWDAFSVDPARNTEPKRFLSVLGRKIADQRGRILFEFPLTPEPSIQISFKADVMHVGVGAYPDRRLELDILVKREYN